MYKHHGDEQNRTSQNSWFYESFNKEFNTFLTEGHQMFLVEKGEQVKDKTFPVTVNVSK